MHTFLIKLKTFFVKLFCNTILSVDHTQDSIDRAESFLQSLKYFTPLAFILGTLNAWYMDNQEFAYAMVVIVFINMILGAVMHFKTGQFKWEKLLVKTITMVIVIGVTYIVLEVIISFAGEGMIVTGFRAALQIATLLYPGAKILKHVFVLSNGEYPPEWIMRKIYNFQENGDLKEFLGK
ncbi:hypothetical protein [Christiangramia crocea]|uniref:Uncharacterized protein n=1 Tax=Christiangramia crocea TaxID=2904124 RepID=A0A9X2A4Y5_9FLAO|nr:hypothetical protein [Gramella crocea]MCG9970979.1 hypothetical protein [Gramella crocea]